MNDQKYCLRCDYQRSLTGLADQEGKFVVEYRFDAWGRRHNSTDWTYNNPALTSITDRGYTGHEMMDAFSLINMNGRCYDPRLARMLSPDPFVQAGTSTQSYNRYSYAFNNPLAFTDPSGYVSVGGGYNAMANHWIDHGAYNDYLDQLYARGSYIYSGGQNLVHFTYGGVGGGSCVVSDGDFYSDNYSHDCYFNTSASVFQKLGKLIGSKGELFPMIFLIDKSNLGGPDDNDHLGQVYHSCNIPGLSIVWYYSFPVDKNRKDNIVNGGVSIKIEYASPTKLLDPWWAQNIFTDSPQEGNVSPYWDGACYWDGKSSMRNSISYYSKGEMKDHIDENLVNFSDAPSRLTDSEWSGILTLFDGTKRLFSVYYGFKIVNGNTTMKPIHFYLP